MIRLILPFVLVVTGLWAWSLATTGGPWSVYDQGLLLNELDDSSQQEAVSITSTAAANQARRRVPRSRSSLRTALFSASC